MKTATHGIMEYRTIANNGVDTTYISSPLMVAEADAEVSKLRRQGLHAFSQSARKPKQGEHWRDIPRYVLYTLPTIN